MRAAPLKGDCLICQAPEPTRVAINAAIWPGEGMMRSVTYRADGVDVARNSKVPNLERCNVKTITRHAEHVEESWREIPANGRMRPDEVPVKGDFASLVEQGGRLGAKALTALEAMLDTNPEVAAVLMTKEVISMAKLGVGAATAGEASRLKRNQQAIDVMAIFATGSGHIPAAPLEDDFDEPPADVLKAALHEERRLLAERAG